MASIFFGYLAKQKQPEKFCVKSYLLFFFILHSEIKEGLVFVSLKFFVLNFLPVFMISFVENSLVKIL
jgi:hypothetical protein